jgi:hypothetical protein
VGHGIGRRAANYANYLRQLLDLIEDGLALALGVFATGIKSYARQRRVIPVADGSPFCGICVSPCASCTVKQPEGGIAGRCNCARAGGCPCAHRTKERSTQGVRGGGQGGLPAAMYLPSRFTVLQFSLRRRLPFDRVLAVLTWCTILSSTWIEREGGSPPVRVAQSVCTCSDSEALVLWELANTQIHPCMPE